MIKQELIKKLEQTKKASVSLGMSLAWQRNRALNEIAKILGQNQKEILKANQKDVKKMPPNHPRQDRLLLTKERIKSIVKDIKTVVKLSDPLNQVLEQRKLPNGLKLKKIAVPFGVIGVIYESRPNVTVDVVSLCLKSGNAVILKGGSEAVHSNRILVKLMKQAVRQAGLSQDLILNIDYADHHVMKQLLGARDYIDLIIPRGGNALIDFVQENAKMPVIETGAGVCHTFVDESADIKMAVDIINNAKTSRPSVCNALDTLLVHQRIASELLPALSQKLIKSQVKIFADVDGYKILERLKYPY